MNNSFDQEIVDVHAHLTDREFEKDISEVIKESQKNGVKAALVVSIGKDDFPKIIELQNRFPDFVLPCVGIHPVQQYIHTSDIEQLFKGHGDKQRSVSLQDFEGVLECIEMYKDIIAGVGEVGLDFSPRFVAQDSRKEEQRFILTKQAEIADKLGLTLNVHSRSAGRPTIALLKELGIKNVHLHAFDGKPSVAMEGVREGYFFSIPPSIVRSEQKQKLVKQIPLENMLLETDSPALGPVKMERNVPSNLKIVVDYIAKVKKVEPSEVRRITTQNAIKLYPKLARFFVK